MDGPDETNVEMFDLNKQKQNRVWRQIKISILTVRHGGGGMMMQG